MQKKIVTLLGTIGLIVIPSLFFGISYLIEQNFACQLTPANPGGPNYIPDAPFKVVMGLDLPGERFYLKGRVINQDCNPVSDVTLDFWHTDSEGNYDMDGYILRGKLKTDKEGSFSLDTIFSCHIFRKWVNPTTSYSCQSLDSRTGQSYYPALLFR